MNEIKCERCVFAFWDAGDESVGLQSYVDGCENKSRLAKECFELIQSGETDECSFFIEQLIPEYEIVRCPKCNSRNTVLICHDECSLTGNFKCGKCDNEFVSDLPMC